MSATFGNLLGETFSIVFGTGVDESMSVTFGNQQARFRACWQNRFAFVALEKNLQVSKVSFPHSLSDSSYDLDQSFEEPPRYARRAPFELSLSDIYVLKKASRLVCDTRDIKIQRTNPHSVLSYWVAGRLGRDSGHSHRRFFRHSNKLESPRFSRFPYRSNQTRDLARFAGRDDANARRDDRAARDRREQLRQLRQQTTRRRRYRGPVSHTIPASLLCVFFRERHDGRRKEERARAP